MLFNTHTHTLYFSPSDSSLLSILFSFSPVFFCADLPLLRALRFMSGVRRDWSKCYRVTCEWVLCLQVSWAAILNFKSKQEKRFYRSREQNNHLIPELGRPYAASHLQPNGLLFVSAPFRAILLNRRKILPSSSKQKSKRELQVLLLTVPWFIYFFLLLLFWLIPGWLVGRSFFLDPTAEGLRDLGMLQNLTQSPVPFS